METPIVFLNPITGKLDKIPTEMVSAYVPYATMLDLETAAKVATLRDDEAANNLLLSIVEELMPNVEMITSQGVDEITAQPVGAHR